MRHSSNKRIIDNMNAEHIPWCWNDRLPANYKGLYWVPMWLSERKRFPVILLGAKEWRDRFSESRAAAFQDFVKRALRMSKITTKTPEEAREHPVVRRIFDHARDVWPAVRNDSWKFFGGRVDGRRLECGIPVYIERDPQEEEAEMMAAQGAMWEMNSKRRMARQILQTMRDIKQLEG